MNAFDESEIAYSDDLPEELKKELIRNSGGGGRLRPVLMRLIGQNGTVTVNDLLIGLYRAEGVVVKRPNALAHLKALRDRGFVESKARGTYQLTEQGEEIFERACEPR